MTFKSKRTITNMAAGVALAGGYTLYALGRKAPAEGDVSAWAVAMLIFIGISVVATIIIQILFHIAYSVGVAVKERAQGDKEVERIIASESAEDEMDKIVGLKSSRVGYICAGIGVIATFVWFAFFGTSAVVALHILGGAMCLSSFVEGCASLFFYERGIGNG